MSHQLAILCKVVMSVAMLASTSGAFAAGAVPPADVLAVSASGRPGAYSFSVQIKSPDTGCAQYADWWEVLDTRGKLLYRRILFHSHAGEQPFERDGGPVPIQADTTVWVRAHLHPGGYGGVVFAGSPKGGFKALRTPVEIPAAVERQAPQPDNCAF